MQGAVERSEDPPKSPVNGGSSLLLDRTLRTETMNRYISFLVILLASIFGLARPCPRPAIAARRLRLSGRRTARHGIRSPRRRPVPRRGRRGPYLRARHPGQGRGTRQADDAAAGQSTPRQAQGPDRPDAGRSRRLGKPPGKAADKAAASRATIRQGAGNKPVASPEKTAPLTAEERQMVLDIRKKLVKFFNRPPNPAIAETAVLRVTTSPDAEPGVRELRLETPAGLTNPLVFQIGRLPEVVRKPVDDDDLPGQQPLRKLKRRRAFRRRRATGHRRPTAGGRQWADPLRAGRSLSLRGEEGAAPGLCRQCPAVGAVHCRRRAGLVPGHDPAQRRGGQGTGLRRQLPLPSRSGAAL